MATVETPAVERVHLIPTLIISGVAKVTIAGLGPAGEQFITAEVQALLDGDAPVFLRTRHHPAAEGLLQKSNIATFDSVYDSASTIEEVYATIVERLVEAAGIHGEVVYIVPGSPLIAESAVALLRNDPRVETSIRPALSFLDLAWARIGVDPLAVSPRLVDGYRFAQEAAGERGPLLVGQCDNRMVLSDIKLAFEDGEPEKALVLQRLGLPDENVEWVQWEDLDRSFEPDHLTSIWIPELAAPVAAEFVRLNEVSRRLRQECPWDQTQTHESLTRYAIEETYELVEAIENLAMDPDENDEHLIEELGDVLFQVFFHSTIAAEEGRFNISDVAKGVADKLIHRHPHVYGDVVAGTADEVLSNWETNKMKEKGRASVMDGIPKHLPALMYAQKILKKAAGQNTEIDIESLRISDTAKALLSMVDGARRQGIDAEAELRQAASAFLEAFESKKTSE